MQIGEGDGNKLKCLMKKLVIDPTPLKFETGEYLVQLHYKQIYSLPLSSSKNCKSQAGLILATYCMPFITNAFFSTKNSKNTCCLRRCSFLNALNLAKWGVKIQNCTHLLDFVPLLVGNNNHRLHSHNLTKIIII